MAWTWLVLKIILIIVGFVLVVSLLQFLVSIHPPRYDDADIPSNYGLEYEKVAFKTEDGIVIRAWLISSEKAKGTVIVGHGYPFSKGNILPVAKFLYPDYNLLFYDHRYFGESEGWITTVGKKEVEDVKAAVGFVQERLGKEEPLALYGFSLSASAMLMSKTKVKAIIADSPYANLENMVEQIYKRFGALRFPFVKLTNLFPLVFLGVHPEKVSPAEAIKGSGVPILIIHGEKDSQIPVENSYQLKEANKDIELWVVEGCDHGAAQALAGQEYERRVKDFLKKHMGKRSK